MKRIAVLILLVCVVTAALPEEAVRNLQLPADLVERCKAEGGCFLMSRLQIARELAEVVKEEVDKALADGFKEGAMVGYIQGATDANAKGCARGV